MSLDWGMANNRHFPVLTGEPAMSDVAQDAPDELNQGFEFFDRGGGHASSHPAKSQPKQPKWVEEY